ncbi:dihydroorotate dehydrogenase (quinone), mitochondrial [Drosophila grimshawi]|uniref:Dihydroorotate dehydrogenase (quinone), mitochondrial n=1 Tax=Drosophila grimshawi TaxID=7222 RepID=B4JSS4_DROGR|nr:dihydroorotate dehydrogenase (quinone), mitochondrial [Drosophila grimshawi]EDV94814.1 GH22897 [Drosophila grimshawi]
MAPLSSFLKMVLQKTQKINRLRSLGIVTAGATALLAGLTAYNNQDHLFGTFVMPAIRLLPAEASHNLAVLACKYRLYPASEQMDDLNLHSTFFGRLISNPIGIAAGFDKNAEAVIGLKDLGFGFIEVGSVTPLPQPGNPKPRVFRLSEDRAIINRYGFNSDGHQLVAERLREFRQREDFNAVVGVNLGRNRDSLTPISDYVQGVLELGPVADYLVVNVSSPNTKGLRDMQCKKELTTLLEAVTRARTELKTNPKVPILLKISPDLALDDLKDIVAVINTKQCRVDGLIVSNTTVARENISASKLANETGGLSGEPLRQRSTELIAQMYALTKGRVPIIGVGGVASGHDAFEKIEAGASFVQIYTALVYEGPDLVDRIKEDLSQQLNERGFKNVRDAVGSNHLQYLP